MDSLRLLFDTSDFPARWNCGDWSPILGWFHILADLAIAGAYAMIPLAIARYCWLKRTELPFPKVLWLFAAFIFSCGSTHLTEAIIFYHPVYRVSAVLKVITAVVSWATVIAIIRIAPRALELPGLLKINRQLQEQLSISKKAHDAAERSNRDLAEFTGVVTHDLRNPMSGALFMAELAKEASEQGDLELTVERIDLVLRSLHQMNRFVGELHEEAISRKVSASHVQVSLHEVLATVMEKLAPTLESVAARLTVDELPTVRGNPTLLLQLFSNLIENAVKYRSEADLVVRITAVAHEHHVRIRVADNGKGVPVADRERIFEPEVRARNAGAVAGSGLGLSLCRRIMDKHHGEIRVAEADHGTTFELTFPKSDPAC